MVGQVGRGEPLRGAGRIALDDVLGALPAERRERHDAGVEPDVPDLGDPLDLLAARLAANADLVDPGAPELLELRRARPVARSSELRLLPITFSCPHEHG